MAYTIELAWTPFDPWHLLVLGVVALLLFGKRLPEVGRSLGKGISEFKKGLQDVHTEIGKNSEPDPPLEKLQPPSEQAAKLDTDQDDDYSKPRRNEPAESNHDSLAAGSDQTRYSAGHQSIFALRSLDRPESR